MIKKKVVSLGKIKPCFTEIKAALRQLTLRNEAVLVLCGSAFKNKGVQAVLDAVIEYLPSPTEVKAITGINEDESEGDLRLISLAHIDCFSHFFLLPKHDFYFPRGSGM